MKLIKIAGFLGLMGLLVFASEARAAFTMTVTPDRGGTDVRFSMVKSGRFVQNQEATIAVTNDEGRQYRITQQQFSPFVNEQGKMLSSGAVKVFSPTSVRGTLNIVFPTSLDEGQKIIYTSDSVGTAVSFALVFALDLGENEPPGYYKSQLIYQLEAAQGGAAPVTKVIHVHVEIAPEFAINIRNAKGGTNLDFGKISRRRLQGEAALEVQISGGLGVPYRLYQVLNDPLSNATGNMIDEEKIGYEVERPTYGEIASSSGKLSRQRTLLYTSDSMGSSANFLINFKTENVSAERSGLYMSSLRYVIESDSSMVPLQPVQLPVKVEVETIFDMELDYGASGLFFGKLKDSGDQVSRLVKIRTYNNTGEQYQITQKVDRPFTNEKGHTIDFKYFTALMRGAQTGEMAYYSTTSLDEGDAVIYTSDFEGSEDTFEIEYTLTLPKNASGGHYTSNTQYSMNAV